jgi:rare lipoprotein A
VKSNSFSRLFGVCLMGAALGGCAHSVIETEASPPIVTGRPAPAEPRTKIAVANPARRATVEHKQTSEAKNETYGLASFYEHDIETASGEKFDPQKLTAAHRTLPFGTRLLVTDVTTGRSVTVRVNDRGPFVHGRIVDVSYIAAEKLGIVERGVAKVKLSVVQ